MTDDADDLFVIDKEGTEEAHPSAILYPFKLEEEQNKETNSESKPPRQRRGPTGKRYHEAEDFNDFRPGQISRELRRALDLKKHELPLHVYRMRTLGYPPGWLRKAKVGGGLMIFDSVTALAEDSEVSYNREALISYPGFNAKIKPPYIDESHQLQCPPMQSHHLLDNFYAALSRGSRWSSNPVETEVPRDLEKLREERERILEEIRRLDSKISGPQGACESGDATEQVETEDQETASNDQPGSTSQNSQSRSSLTNGEAEQSSSNSGSNNSNDNMFFISVPEEGTPTPQRIPLGEDNSGSESSSLAPTKRPSIDAFTVGVQPFRPFENLPGSEGAYQRVLKTLRHCRAAKLVDSQSHDASHQASAHNPHHHRHTSSRARSSTSQRDHSGSHREGNSKNSPFGHLRTDHGR